MDKKNFDIDIVVVTKDRYRQLFKCINNLTNGSIVPSRIIVIDGSLFPKTGIELSLGKICKSKKVVLTFCFSQKRGTGIQRNIGMSLVTSRFFAFIDDDEYVPRFWLERVKDLLREKKNFSVFAGPKIPIDKSNYWHRVWRTLVENELNYRGFVDTIPSGNSIYSFGFIKKNNLKFDTRFKRCSEDQAFSLLLRNLKVKIFFDKNIWVRHDIRRDTKSFILQWYFYGVNKFRYHHLYLESGYWFELNKYGKSLMNFQSTFPYLPKKLDLLSVFGILLLNCVFLFGYSLAFFSLTD